MKRIWHDRIWEEEAVKMSGVCWVARRTGPWVIHSTTSQRVIPRADISAIQVRDELRQVNYNFDADLSVHTS